MNIMARIKHYFFRGLAVILPTILTIWIFIWGYNFIQNNISIYINRGIIWLIVYFKGPTTEEAARAAAQEWAKFWIEGWGAIAGFIIALIIVFIIGALLASVVGKALWKMIEKFIMRAPFLKQVYPYVKQVTDFLFSKEEQKQMFSRVVAVEYPRKGIWSLGMVTGTGLKKVAQNVQKEILTVLIPTSPTPFTGFIIMVPKDQTIELDISTEEALRFTISGGVIIPENNGNNSALLEAEKD